MRRFIKAWEIDMAPILNVVITAPNPHIDIPIITLDRSIQSDKPLVDIGITCIPFFMDMCKAVSDSGAYRIAFVSIFTTEKRSTKPQVKADGFVLALLF